LFTAPDPNLESEVRREAERQVRQSAINGGILKTAADNGRATPACWKASDSSPSSFAELILCGVRL
jgi:hypothetical protein